MSKPVWCVACRRTHRESLMEIYDVANDVYCCTQAAFDKVNGIVRHKNGFIKEFNPKED